MKNKYKYILCFAFFLIAFGSYILFSEDEKKVEKDKTIKPQYEISFLDIVGDEIDVESQGYQYYKIDKLNKSYINDYNITTKNKYIFGYLDNLICIEDDFYKKEFGSTNFNIQAGYFNDFFSLENLLDKVKTEYKNDGYTKMNYSLGNPIIIDENKVSYIKFVAAKENNTLNGENYVEKYKEEFYIYIETIDNVVTIRYKLNNYKFDIETLNQIINSISIEKNKASYLVSKVENQEISGKLTAIDSKNNISNLFYNFSTDKCHEIDSISNGSSSVSFSTSDKKMTFTIKILNVIYDKTHYQDLYSYYKEYLENLYTKNNNIEGYSSKDFIANDKKYLRISFVNKDKKTENISYIEFVNSEIIIIYSFESENKILDSDTIYFLDCDVK